MIGMNPKSPMRRFDPRKVAHYEKENYVAYYQKDWLKLMRVSVELVKETFGLSLPQAMYGAYLVARAEIAFAPFPDNDIPLAQEYTRRFYAFIKRIHREDLNVEETARLEVNWWIVHRKLFGKTENQELVDALIELYAAAYSAEKASLKEAAYHRAQGMLCSDQWVNDGKQPLSALLFQEEEELFRSYVALRSAIVA
jgi:hypothetical protein